jgi:hypothetical protein
MGEVRDSEVDYFETVGASCALPACGADEEEDEDDEEDG